MGKKQKNWDKVRRQADAHRRAELARLKEHHSALYRLNPAPSAEERTVIGWDKEGRPIYRETPREK